MIKKLHFVMALIAMAVTASAQPQLKWAASFGYPAGIKPTAMAVSNTGQIVTAGNFFSQTDFNPGAGTANLNSANGATYITKLDSNRNLVWARQMGFSQPTDSTFVNDIYIDSLGFIYVTGSYRGDANLDPGGQFLTVSQMGTMREAFIIKLRPNGTLLWGRTFTGGNTSVGTSVYAYKENLYIAGYFSGNVGISGLGNITSSSHDMFLAKLDTSGAHQWIVTSAGTAMAYSVTVDEASNVYTSGTFTGTTDFSPGVSGGSLTSAGNRDAFVAKYDDAGTLLWANQLSGTGNEEAHNIVADKKGHILIAGGYSTSIDCDPGTATFMVGGSQPPLGCYGYFLTKHTTAGNFVWAVSPAASGTCNPRLPLSLDTFGNAYVAGDFGDTIDFDPGTGTYNLMPKGPLVTSGIPVLNPDIFVSRINANGSFAWARRFGSAYAKDRAEAIAVDIKGNVHITGTYTDTVDFDPGIGTTNLTTTSITAIPETGAYVQKIWQCPGIKDSLNVTSCINYTFNGTTYTTSGLYTWVIPTAAGCDSITKLNLTINGINTGVMQTNTVLTSQETGATYQWINCLNRLNPAIPGATQATFSSSVTGSYAVVVTKNGCSDTSGCFFLFGTGAADVNSATKPSLYPNPATEKVMIDFGGMHSNMTVEVSNIAGQLMQTKTITNASGTELKIDGPKGVYLIKLTNDKGQASYLKLVKE